MILWDCAYLFIEMTIYIWGEYTRITSLKFLYRNYMTPIYIYANINTQYVNTLPTPTNAYATSRLAIT